MRLRWSPGRLARAARAGLGMAIGMLVYPIAWFGWFRPRDRLADAVAQLLLVGFYGANPSSPSARLLARQVRRGQVGGIFFVSQNIGSTEEVTALLRLFRAGGAKPLLAIDHEGGVVQRLGEAHGFTRLPSAREVATSLTIAEARELYAIAGRELAALGFTVNLGPVVDVDDPDNEAIGVFGRAYDTEPDRIAAYAEAFVDGFAEAGITCVVKHFPGHGRAAGDSHHGPADISTTWAEEELEPFARLIDAGRAPVVMTGHLRLDAIAPDGAPATISSAIVGGLLRGRLGYRGVIATDDLDMGAVSRILGRKQAVVQAIRAGNDLLMIKNLFGYDPLMPQRAVGWVRAAITRGILTEQHVIDAADRVRSIRRVGKASS